MPGFSTKSCELKDESATDIFFTVDRADGFLLRSRRQFAAAASIFGGPARAIGQFFQLVSGDSSRIFANDFYVKADAYYHSGFYPTIFDNNEAFKTSHLAEDTGAVASRNKGEETEFLGEPRDWIDAFSRHFIPNRHTHLDAGGPSDDLSDSSEVREILPWLKLSTELDPDNIQTYTVSAYWLRRIGKIAEAKQVLHEGLRHNPGNYHILFELGRLFYESDHDPTAPATSGWWRYDIGRRKAPAPKPTPRIS